MRIATLSTFSLTLTLIFLFALTLTFLFALTLALALALALTFTFTLGSHLVNRWFPLAHTRHAFGTIQHRGSFLIAVYALHRIAAFCIKLSPCLSCKYITPYITLCQYQYARFIVQNFIFLHNKKG